LLDGVSRRCRTVGYRMLSGQPADQGLQRPGLRLRRQPVRRVSGQRSGGRFVDSDYWSGQMMAEVKSEIESARGPIYLKVSHLPDETLSTLENILHTTERPTRGTFQPTAATTTAPMISRCTSPRSRCAVGIPPPGCGSTNMPAPRCPACTPPVTWPACSTTT